MYMTPELRYGLYSIDPNELGANDVGYCLYSHICIVKFTHNFSCYYDNQMEADEIVADENMLKQMTDIKLNEIGSRKALVATKNIGIDEARSYYEQNESDPLFNIATDEVKKKKRKPRYIPIELQKLFTNLQLLNEKSISTEGILKF